MVSEPLPCPIEYGVLCCQAIPVGARGHRQSARAGIFRSTIGGSAISCRCQRRCVLPGGPPRSHRNIRSADRTTSVTSSRRRCRPASSASARPTPRRRYIWLANYPVAPGHCGIHCIADWDWLRDRGDGVIILLDRRFVDPDQRFPIGAVEHVDQPVLHVSAMPLRNLPP